MDQIVEYEITDAAVKERKEKKNGYIAKMFGSNEIAGRLNGFARGISELSGITNVVTDRLFPVAECAYTKYLYTYCTRAVK